MLMSVMFFSTGSGPAADVVYRRIADIARLADADGMKRIWLPERHFVEFGAIHPAPAVLAAALTGSTRSIRLAAGSVVAPLHDPIRVAEAWSVVDNLSGGRVDLALAPGWRAEDFALAPDRYADRHRILEESASSIRQLWRGEALYRRLGDGRSVAIRTEPRPIQPELPLWITAARNPETFKLAGTLGANLLTYLVDLGLEGLSARIGDYRAARAAAGHNPRAGLVTVMLHTHLAASTADAHARARGPYIASVLRNRALLDSHAAGSLSEAQAGEIAAAQFDRIFERLSLVGSIQSGESLVMRLAELGVDEIACLIDFVEDFDTVERGLPVLSQLVALTRTPRTRREQPIGEKVSRCDVSRHSAAEFYAYIESIGGHYGPSFRSIETIELTENCADVVLALPGGASAPDPILVDAAISTAHAFALRPALRASMRPLALPIGIGRLRLESVRADRYRVRARELARDAETATFEMDIETADGAPVGNLERVAYKRIPLTSADPRIICARATFHCLTWTCLDQLGHVRPVTWTVDDDDNSNPTPLAQALAATFVPGTQAALIVTQHSPWRYGDREAPRAATLHVLASIAQLRAERRVEWIVVVVRGAHSLPSDGFLPDPAAAAAWAAAGSVRAVPGRAPVRVLDVSPDASPLEVARALSAFVVLDAPPMAAARAGTLFVPSLAPMAPPAARRELGPLDRVLVTGGHGHLGTILTDWLLEDGTREAVALSRSGPRWRSLANPNSGHIVDLKGDVAAIGNALDTVLRGPFDAIFHLAGTDLGDANDATAIDAVFAPKFDGLLALAEHAVATGTRGPLFLFASSAALVGATGQPAYAAANAASVAAAAHVRSHSHLEVLALALDPVRGVGMAGSSNVADSLAARAIVPLDLLTALRAVGLAMAGSLDNVAIVTPGNHGTKGLDSAVVAVAAAPSGPSMLPILRGLDKSTGLLEIIERIRREVADILEVPPEEVDTRANLYDIGFDSVMALELRNSLSQKYGVEVGLVALMEAQCLEDVAHAILPALARMFDDRLTPVEPATDIVL
jgi:phthiocerol/phenolphthiocerol synthesis type-I polyketide synthase D